LSYIVPYSQFISKCIKPKETLDKKLKREIAYISKPNCKKDFFTVVSDEDDHRNKNKSSIKFLSPYLSSQETLLEATNMVSNNLLLQENSQIAIPAS
jgi:hypothetical protein